MRKLPVILLFLSSLGFAGANAAELIPASNGYHKQRVVYHINDAGVAGTALRNIQNHINAVGAGNADIVVVTHGKGIDFLLEDWKDADGKSYESRIHELSTQGVSFQVCNNTLVGRKIDAAKVNMNAEVVPSGVATVGELQLQGYVYIKP
jgi:intracellular sulfur oxidation DsrE/DsrF family protein